MTLKSLLAALALTIAPTLAAASCFGEQHTTMSCAEGSTWDAESQTCVPIAST